MTSPNLNERRYVNGKLMRYGYTTGSCATAASKASAVFALSGKAPSFVEIDTPKGIVLQIQVQSATFQPQTQSYQCSVQKDAGDDPDVTHGILVYSEVTCIPEGIEIDGGLGVGRVTKPGLDQPVGQAAINSVPRAMIVETLQQVAKEYGYSGGFRVVIHIPDGVELARRTFNPKLGIEGGISVIGTTGIVEPMSDKAVEATIEVEVKMIAAAGSDKLLVNLGNIGEAFTSQYLNLEIASSVKCANFLGAAVDSAVAFGIHHVLIVGHLGKLVKLGIGMFNTHSNNGDGRMDILAACAAKAGAGIDTVLAVLDSATTDKAAEVLEAAELLERTMQILTERIEDSIQRRIPHDYHVEFICFTGREGSWSLVAKSKGAENMSLLWNQEKHTGEESI